MEKLTYKDCLDCLEGTEGCYGSVYYRMSLSPSGRSYPRCDKHWEERLDTEERLNRDYPEFAPDWFDPANAGEHWGEDY